MKVNFKNQVVIVTGGTGNIGYSIIKKLSSFGAQIYATSTSKEKIIKLNPDRITLLGMDHRPDVYKHQNAYRKDLHANIQHP